MKATANASVAEPGAEPTPTTPRSSRNSAVALAVAIATVIGVSLIRVASLGFAPVAPDDAVYIGVGRSLWGLHEPLGIDGTLFTVRSWAFPVMTGGASRACSTATCSATTRSPGPASSAGCSAPPRSRSRS